MWTPDSIATLQHAVAVNLPDQYRAFADMVNEESGRFAIRGHVPHQERRGIGRRPIDHRKGRTRR
jgi:glutamate synthase (NADPH/NADH) large chain